MTNKITPARSDFAARRLACRLMLIIISLPFFLVFANPVSAWDYEKPVIVDASEAHDRSLRNDRDVVEGFWAIYMEWQPEEGASKSYRMAVVKNNYEVYDGSDYVGVVTCDRPGCTRGEIKLALKKTDDPIKFDATLLMGGRGISNGIAVLGPHKETGREKGVLDLSSLRYKDRQLTYGLVRIMNG